MKIKEIHSACDEGRSFSRLIGIRKTWGVGTEPFPTLNVILRRDDEESIQMVIRVDPSLTLRKTCDLGKGSPPTASVILRKDDEESMQLVIRIDPSLTLRKTWGVGKKPFSTLSVILRKDDEESIQLVIRVDPSPDSSGSGRLGVWRRSPPTNHKCHSEEG